MDFIALGIILTVFCVAVIFFMNDDEDPNENYYRRFQEEL